MHSRSPLPLYFNLTFQVHGGLGRRAALSLHLRRGVDIAAAAAAVAAGRGQAQAAVQDWWANV